MNTTQASSRDLRRLEQLLHEQREAVESKLERLLGRSEEECALTLNEDVFSAREEAMLAEIDDGYQVEAGHLRNELAVIEAALHRHAHATYGLCMHCGQPIPVERLLQEPTAAHCGACEAAHRDSVQHESSASGTAAEGHTTR